MRLCSALSGSQVDLAAHHDTTGKSSWTHLSTWKTFSSVSPGEMQSCTRERGTQDPSGDIYAPGKNKALFNSFYRGRKFCPASPGPQVQEYGGFSKINDNIGILLEYKEGVGSLSFYRNGVSSLNISSNDVNFRLHLGRPSITYRLGLITQQCACITEKSRSH